VLLRAFLILVLRVSTNTQANQACLYPTAFEFGRWRQGVAIMSETSIKKMAKVIPPYPFET